MKLKILLIAFFMANVAISYAQNKDNRWATNIALHLNQYDGDLGNEIFGLGAPGLSFGKEAYINPSFNWFWDISVDALDFNSFERAFVDSDMGLRYKLNNGYLMSENSSFKPYLTAGVGLASMNGGKTEFPLGAGFRVELQEGLDLRVDAIYNIVNSNDYNYFQNTIGLVIYTGRSKKPADTDGDGIADIDDDCPSVVGVASRNGCPEPVDSDGDGIPDDGDQCPMLAGVSTANGCPDSDGDGIKDSEDKCPKIKGTTINNGCPDSDGDGVIDSMDDCPNVAGSASTKGCPDSDSDGVIDSKDKCPKVAGVASNKGCPEVDEETKAVLAQALKGVQFESGKDVIKRSSYKDLDNVAAIMQSHNSYKLTISGYTDNTGNPNSNLSLSDKRAKAAMKYIVDKGVDQSRISAKGYGIASPVADNNTATGRAKNRRVEFKIEF